MSAIWMEGSDGQWSLQTPVGYDNEESLHDMVMSTPQLLPLSGSPTITVLGREVALPPAGYADVVAIEGDSRPVIIEVKLRNNAESRRAVIAKTLSYAASLHAVTRPELEEVILGRHLNGQSIFDRVRDTEPPRKSGDSVPWEGWSHVRSTSKRYPAELRERRSGWSPRSGLITSRTGPR